MELRVFTARARPWES